MTEFVCIGEVVLRRASRKPEHSESDRQNITNGGPQAAASITLRFLE
jgi:hypothetical protein